MTTIALTTDLGPDEGPVIATAVALAVRSGSRLVSVHASTGADVTRLNAAPDLAASWGVALEHEAMIHTCCDDITDTLLDALRRLGPALVVAGTHGRHGILQLLASSVTEAVARNVSVPTLVVPVGGPGLIDPATGALRFRRVLVAAGDAASARAGLEGAAWLAGLAGAGEVEVVALHVGAGSPPPAYVAPPGVRLVSATLDGPLELTLARQAAERDACALVMASRGHDSVVDVLAGSHSERVLRQVRCPVLLVPMSS